MIQELPETMVLRYLFNYLFNHPEIVNKLSDSYVIRRAAQMTVYVYHKGKRIGEGAIQDGLKQGTQRLNSFTDKFKEELEREMREAKKKR